MTTQTRGVTLERAATLFTAAIASVVAAQGMYVMFSEALHMPLPLQLLCFGFIELMVVTSAMRARRSQLDTGSAGVDGIAMWVLTVLSGVLAATHAADTGTLLLRLIAPLIAAWGWERSMALERRQLTGRAGGINWRISPRRLLVRWGIADPTDRTTAQIAVERRLADLARAADGVRMARTLGGGPRRVRRAMERLHRAIDKAADDGVVLGEPAVRERLREHLEGRFSAYTLPDYNPVMNWAQPTAEHWSPQAVPAVLGLEDELAELVAASARRGDPAAVGKHLVELPDDERDSPAVGYDEHSVGASDGHADSETESLEFEAPGTFAADQAAFDARDSASHDSASPAARHSVSRSEGSARHAQNSMRQPTDLASGHGDAVDLQAGPPPNPPEAPADSPRRPMAPVGSGQTGRDAQTVGGALAVVPDVGAHGDWHDLAERICAGGSGRRAPEQVAEILRLKHDGEMSNLAIAHAVGVGVGTVRRVLTDAQKHLEG